MEQQTAVEWLIEGIHKNMGVWIPTHIQEQAKAMEKEQIKDAYLQGDEDGFHSMESQADYEIENRSDYVSEKYYNETYKTK